LRVDWLSSQNLQRQKNGFQEKHIPEIEDGRPGLFPTGLVLCYAGR
jgi:hypothetical protein